MKLRRVEIHGFKSFGRKTILEFPEGVSCIIGPNGTGKSNVIDAICFAMGYPSRNLRASRAQELIHSGIGSVNEAKVAITLSDGENALEVKRRCDRGGRSVYKINSIISNLDNLHETLSKYGVPRDGFNIVMQNDVTKFIEVKPIERRKILDEISGISGYEEKKKRSLDELAIVERRISDTNLILSEKKGYLDEISKDREVAMEYQDMQEELLKKRAIMLYSNLYQFENGAGELEEKISELNKEKDIKIIELARLEEEMEGITQRLDGITNKIVESTSSEHGKIKGGIGSLKTAIEKKQEEIQFLKDEIAALNQKKEEASKKMQEMLKQIKSKEQEREGLKERVLDVEKVLKLKDEGREKVVGNYDNSELIGLENQRKKVAGELFEARKTLTIIENELDGISTKENEISGNIAAKSSEIRSLEKDLKSIQIQQKAINDRLDGINLKAKKELDKKEKATRRKEDLQRELDGIREKLTELYQEFARLESEIKVTEKLEHKVGESKSLKFVLDSKGKIGGFLGIVSELGSIDDEYKVAVEVAIGNKANNIVVEDDKVAESYIKELRKNKVGRATFLPINKLKTPKIREYKKVEGVIGLAKELVKCDKRFQKVFDYVFADTLVVADIEAAREVGIGKIRMVTLDGDLITAGGAMTGGFYEKSTVTFSSTEERKKRLGSIRKEITKLRDEQSGVEAELKKTEALADLAIRDAGGEDKINLEVLKERGSNITEKIDLLKKDIEELKRISGELGARQKDLVNEKSEAGGNTLRLEKKEKSLAEKLDLEAFKELNETLRRIDDEIHRIRDKKFKIQAQENSLNSGVDSLKSKLMDMENATKEVEDSIKKFEGKITDSINQITKYGADLRALEEQHSQISSESKRLFKEQERLNQVLNELGENRDKLEIELENAKNAINDLSIKKARVDTKLEEVQTVISGVEKPDASEIEKANLKEIKTRVGQLERELEGIGAVNLRAVELYEELERQYKEIKEKNERLYIEKEKIYDLIEIIEEKKKTVFFESFYKVKENFMRLIPELYPTTEGNLVLENENDPFNSGLIIEVKPGGRDLMNIDSLSGGEKVLTAFAFLMATQAVNQSPFYILDEVDAALDQENVMRLVKFLRNLDESQFILISHNPETVKHMDAVIGITMQEGISQTVGVDMQMVDI